MKSIIFSAIIGSIRAKVDKSISATFSTPELTPDERSYFFEMQNLNVEMTIKPLDEIVASEIRIDKELEERTPSMRLRNSIYVLLEKKLGRKPEQKEWEDYYRSQMEKIIQKVKDIITEYE